MDNIPSEIEILCVYCNAPWTAQMNAELLNISTGCDTCGYGASTTIRLEIRCSNCSRIVYVKEIKSE